MFKSYLLTAYRNILRSKGFSIINLVGLAIGLTAFIIITLWVSDEMSYDKHISNANQVYRIIYRDANWSQPRTPHPMPLAMVADFPEVESGVSLSPLFGSGLSKTQFTFKYKDVSFEESEVLSVDTTFFEVFPFEMILGDPKDALSAPGGIILTLSTAKKYFGDSDPIGEVLEVNGDTKLYVTGVVQDIPSNTHFTFDFLVSYVSLKQQSRSRNDGNLSDYYTWNDFGHYNYIKLAKDADPKEVESRLFKWIQNYIPFSPEQLDELIKTKATLELQPIGDIHLKSNMPWELRENGNIVYVYAFSLVALLILGIAIFNYINLTTAKYEKRAKEVGVRKTLGAQRKQLVGQFLSESVLMVIISLIFALLIVELIIPSFNQIAGKSFGNILSFESTIWIVLLVVVVLIGILSGSYPAFFLSGFKPNEVIKGKVKVSGSNISLRKILVSFQFAISVILIICTLGIYFQIDFLRKQDMGFDSQNIMVVPIRSNNIEQRFEAFKEKLVAIDGVNIASGVSNVPGDQFNNNSIQWKIDDYEVNAAEMFVDDDFFELMQLNIIEGRSFSKEFSADSIGAFILNKEACAKLGLKNPIGEIITWYGDNPGTVKGKVIGVTDNFHFQSLHLGVKPLIIQRLYSSGQIGSILIRLSSNSYSRIAKEVEEIYEEFETTIPFKYSFLQSDLGNLYKTEGSLGVLFLIFTSLAVFVACLGLFGLAAFSAEQRTKEIGIRKVHGASTGEIYLMLSLSFAKLALLSNIIAWPLAYFMLNRWMNNFEYKVELGIAIYFIAATATIIVSILTTGYQSYKVSTQTPVESLKYE